MSSCCPSDLVAADLRLGPHNTKVTIDDMRRLVFDSSSISDDDYVNIIGSMKNETTTRQKTKVVVHAGESLLSMNLYMKALIHVAIFHLGFLVLWRRWWMGIWLRGWQLHGCYQRRVLSKRPCRQNLHGRHTYGSVSEETKRDSQPTLILSWSHTSSSYLLGAHLICLRRLPNTFLLVNSYSSLSTSARSGRQVERGESKQISSLLGLHPPSCVAF